MVSERKPPLVFIDTNVLISLYNIKDSLHKKAMVVFKRLSLIKARLVISNYVLLETYTILSQKAGKKNAIEFGKLIRKENPFIIKWVEEKDDAKVWEIFKKVKDKNVSYVDCSILTLVTLEDYELATFDQKIQKLADNFGFKLFKLQ